jgi:hypothetical protein
MEMVETGTAGSDNTLLTASDFSNFVSKTCWHLLYFHFYRICVFELKEKGF